jgi:hypothetical protein
MVFLFFYFFLFYQDSNPKRSLLHMRIADNNRNNRVDADSNRMMRMRMQIPKNDNCIMRM